MIENPPSHRRNERGNDHFLPVLSDCGRREGSGRLGVDLLGQAGNFTGSGLFVEHPFFRGFVNSGLGLVKLLCGVFCILGYCEAYILDDIFYPGLNRFVAQAPLLVLTGALQC